MSKVSKVPRSLNLKRYSSGFRLSVCAATQGKRRIYASNLPAWSAARNTKKFVVRELQLSDSIICELHRKLEQRWAKELQEELV